MDADDIGNIIHLQLLISMVNSVLNDHDAAQITKLELKQFLPRILKLDCLIFIVFKRALTLTRVGGGFSYT